MAITIRNKVEGLKIIYGSGDTQFYPNNSALLAIKNGKLFINNTKIATLPADVAAIYDDVLTQQPAVGGTIAAIFDQVYPFLNKQPLYVTSNLYGLKKASVTYNFATMGGAVSEISSGVTIPNGSIIHSIITENIVTLTSTGSTGTIGLELGLAGTVVTALKTANGSADAIVMEAAGTCQQRLAADKILYFKIQTNPITAGQWKADVFYY